MIIFYDGSCGFCRRRMEKLKQRDKNNVLVFDDVSDDPTAGELFGIDVKDVSAVEVDGNLEPTKIYTGASVWIAAHEAMGYRFARLLWLPPLKQLMDIGYFVLSKLRRYL